MCKGEGGREEERRGGREGMVRIGMPIYTIVPRGRQYILNF